MRKNEYYTDAQIVLMKKKMFNSHSATLRLYRFIHYSLSPDYNTLGVSHLLTQSVQSGFLYLPDGEDNSDAEDLLRARHPHPPSTKPSPRPH